MRQSCVASKWTMLAIAVQGSILAVSPVRAAGTNYVWAGGSETSPYDSWATAARSIPVAVAYANANSATFDTVLVTNDTYTVTAEIVLAAAITVRSVNGAAVTTVQRAASGTTRIFRLSNTGAVLDGFTVRYGNQTLGSGISMSVGTVQRCVITANNGGDGAGIYMTGGTVQHCTISKNATASSGNGSNIGGGGILAASGTCTIRNCLIMGNTAAHTGSGTGGGILRTGGTVSVENCTVVGNRAAGTGGGAGGVQGAVTLKNSIVILNSTASAGDADLQGVTPVTYSCSPTLSGATNFNGDPQFMANGSGAGAAHVPGDYRLRSASACIGAGTALAWHGGALDLAGANRVIGTAVDMGAYEADPDHAALGCRFVAAPTRGTNTLQTVFTATVGGSNLVNVAYYWAFGDGQTAAGTGRGTVTNVYGPGTFTVSLAVTNAALESAAQSQASLVRVLTTATVYCGPQGLNIAPYTNWTMAASSLQSAIDQGLALVLVSNNTYNISAAVRIDKANTVRSMNGWSNTVIRRTGGTTRVVHISHPDAVLDGFTVRDGNMSDSGSGIYMTGGTVRNCMVTNNSASNGSGVGIYMANGLVENTTIAKNWGRDGAGISMRAGLVRNCTFWKNKTDTAGGGNTGGGGIWAATGECVIRNCLLMGNSSLHTSNGGGGGILVTSGKAIVENCTLVGNYGGAGPGGAQARDSGKLYLTNSIVRLNGRYAASELNVTCTASGYSCSPNLPSGNGNVTGDPSFNANGNGLFGDSFVPGDYHLQAASPCVNQGVDRGWMLAGATDLDGRVRVLDGAVDMGVYEVDPDDAPLACFFSATPGSGSVSAEVVLAATVSGHGSGGAVGYYWTLGDGARVSGVGRSTVTNTYLAGLYGPVLHVTNAFDEGATYALSPSIRVTTPETTYCAMGGLGIAPYTNWIMAATDPREAIAQGEGLVLVGPGTYGIAQLPIALTRANVVQSSEGWPVTILRCTTGNTRLFTLSHAGAVLDGFTLTDGVQSGNGGGLLLEQGTVRNCCFTNNAASAGAGLHLSNGLVEDCRFYRNVCNYGSGGGVYMAGGVVRNCIFSQNATSGAGGDSGGGNVYMTGGALRNSLLMGGEARHPTSDSSGGGGVSASSAAALIENCTVVGNAVVSPAGHGGGVRGGTVRNSIVRGNSCASEADLYGVAATWSCSPGLSGSGNLDVDPQFVAAGAGSGFTHVAGDYHLQRDSLCLNAGTTLAWHADATDLDGAPRTSGPGVDMGVYERTHIPAGMVILLR